MTRMEPFRKRPAANLSGGMKQKLALICTLLHHPQVLFLDEPTNGVDPVSRRDFWAILYQLVRDGLTVFVTTAYLDEAERCNRVGLMNQGRMIQCEAPRELKRSLAEICYEVQAPDQRSERVSTVAAGSANGRAGRSQAPPVPSARHSPERLKVAVGATIPPDRTVARRRLHRPGKKIGGRPCQLVPIVAHALVRAVLHSCEHKLAFTRV